MAACLAAAPPEWGVQFRDQVNALVAAQDHATPCDRNAPGPDATFAVATPEHQVPLPYALALQRDDDAVSVFNDDVSATLAMTSFLVTART